MPPKMLNGCLEASTHRSVYELNRPSHASVKFSPRVFIRMLRQGRVEGSRRRHGAAGEAEGLARCPVALGV